MVLSNVVFNYILIFGKFGFPQLGIAGAAIGSSLSELVSVIFFIIYTWKRIDCKKYALNILPKFQGQTLKRILNVSVWTMIQNFVSLSTWFMFFLFVEHLGERSLAIANIIRNVSGIPFMIAMAFAATCGSLVSNLIGAGEQDCVRGTIRQHIRIGYVFVIPILIFFCLFPDLVLSIYTDMPDLGSVYSFSLGVMLSLSGSSTCQRLFSVGIRYGKHAHSLSYGTVCTGNLCYLCNLLYTIYANGYRICLDYGKCIRHFHSNILLQV